MHSLDNTQKLTYCHKIAILVCRKQGEKNLSEIIDEIVNKYAIESKKIKSISINNLNNLDVEPIKRACQFLGEENNGIFFKLF